MKKLFTFLILFSVNSFADNYCYVEGDDAFEIKELIETCDEGDVLLATVDDKLTPMVTINFLSVWFCNFDKQIIINSDESTTYLQCILEDNEKRSGL